MPTKQENQGQQIPKIFSIQVSDDHLNNQRISDVDLILQSFTKKRKEKKKGKLTWSGSSWAKVLLLLGDGGLPSTLMAAMRLLPPPQDWGSTTETSFGCCWCCWRLAISFSLSLNWMCLRVVMKHAVVWNFKKLKLGIYSGLVWSRHLLSLKTA